VAPEIFLALFFFITLKSVPFLPFNLVALLLNLPGESKDSWAQWATS
jgi:hypothetical protein